MGDNLLIALVCWGVGGVINFLSYLVWSYRWELMDYIGGKARNNIIGWSFLVSVMFYIAGFSVMMQ